MRFLTDAAIIRCNHGGLVEFNKVQTSWKIGKHQVLTVEAVEAAPIVGCRQMGPGQTPCSCVIEVTRGKVPEAAVDGQIPLSENLDFRTDGTPEGSAILVSSGSLKKSRKRMAVAGLAMVLILGALFGAATLIPRLAGAMQRNIQIEQLQKENLSLRQRKEEYETMITELRRADLNDRFFVVTEERNKYLEERNKYLEERNKYLKERDEAINERDDYKGRLERAESERDTCKQQVKSKVEELAKVVRDNQILKARLSQNAGAQVSREQDAEIEDLQQKLDRKDQVLRECASDLKKCQAYKPVSNYSFQYSPCGHIAYSQDFQSRKELIGEIKKLRDREVERLKREAKAQIDQIEQSKPNSPK